MNEDMVSDIIEILEDKGFKSETYQDEDNDIITHLYKADTCQHTTTIGIIQFDGDEWVNIYINLRGYDKFIGFQSDITPENYMDKMFYIFKLLQDNEKLEE